VTSTANGHTVLEAVVMLPRVMVWQADLVIDSADATPFTGTVTLSLADGALFLVGAPWRPPAVWRDHTHVRIVGGAAKLRTRLDAGAFTKTTARAILLDIVSGAGERLSDTIDPALLGTHLDSWVRLESSAGAALTSIAAELGAVWRVLPDGSIWLGAETWPDAAPSDYTILDRNIEDAIMLIGADAPTLLPGTMFEGGKVGRVVHRLGQANTRTDVTFDD
jgi:hypothetical protein